MLKKNILSILVALIILYLSLANSHTFNRVPLFSIPNIDKIVHFLMYFGFMSVIILENRKSIKHTGQLFFLALIPFFYGVLMEILQAALTVSRTGSFYDVIANSAGICGSILIFWLIKPYINGHIRS